MLETWDVTAKICVTLSGLNALNGLYQILYYKMYLGLKLSDMPIDLRFIGVISIYSIANQKLCHSPSQNQSPLHSINNADPKHANSGLMDEVELSVLGMESVGIDGNFFEDHAHNNSSDNDAMSTVDSELEALIDRKICPIITSLETLESKIKILIDNKLNANIALIVNIDDTAAGGGSSSSETASVRQN